MKTTSQKIRRSFIAAAAVLFATPLAAQAALQVNFTYSELADQGCQLIKAGQTIDAGTVCVALDENEENLLVTYSTAVEDGWELVEAQLWAGLNPDEMPATRKGAPKIGNFPYNSGNITGNITGETVYQFTVPLTETFDDLQSLCANPNDSREAYLAAHSSVQRYDELEGLQTETGWSLGDRIVEKGTWAMMSAIEFTCPVDMALPPVEESCGSAETAYALGDTTFIDLGITNARWGWQVTVNDGEEPLTTPIYAGAGQNDITKGTEVGELAVSYLKGKLTVTYRMFDGFVMEDLHLNVSEKDLVSIAPGSYTVVKENLANGEESESTFTFSGLSAASMNVVAHAVVKEVCNE